MNIPDRKTLTYLHDDGFDCASNCSAGVKESLLRPSTVTTISSVCVDILFVRYSSTRRESDLSHATLVPSDEEIQETILGATRVLTVYNTPPQWHLHSLSDALREWQWSWARMDADWIRIRVDVLMKHSLISDWSGRESAIKPRSLLPPSHK